jgi:hypothetical protein
MTRNVSTGTRKCLRPRYVSSSTAPASLPVIPSQRMNQFTMTRVGNHTISIPRRLNCLAIGTKPPPGDSSTSFCTRPDAAMAKLRASHPPYDWPARQMRSRRSASNVSASHTA